MSEHRCLNCETPHDSIESAVECCACPRCAELETQISAKQARIDELMWEYCPSEMTSEQIDEYSKHQTLAGTPLPRSNKRGQ